MSAFMTGERQQETKASASGESGADLIAAERQRQIDSEGWTPEHDDGHANDLVLAAIAYSYEGIRPNHPMAPAIWPWDEEWWKPSEDRIRNLVKAGALIAAEIDRLYRAAERQQWENRDGHWPDGTVRLPDALESWLDGHFAGEKDDDDDLEAARGATAVALWSLIYRQGDPDTDEAALAAIRAFGGEESR